MYNKKEHPNSKIIVVKRKTPDYENAQDKQLAEGYFSAAYRAIGSYFERGTTLMGKGLNHAEVKLLLPIITGVEADDRDFKKAVETWYAEINTKIPAEGLKLEIGKEFDNNKPLIDYDESKKEWVFIQMPINVSDYIKYKHIESHPLVAKTKSEAEKLPSGFCNFYIDDAEIEARLQIKIIETKDKATKIYQQHKDDVEFMRQTLVLLGVDAFRMTDSDIKVAFRNRIEDTDLRKVEQFISVTTDDLATKMYEVRVFLNQQILKQEGDAILDEGNNYWGSSIREVAINLSQKGNEEKYRLLKARQVLN